MDFNLLINFIYLTYKYLNKNKTLHSNLFIFRIYIPQISNLKMFIAIHNLHIQVVKRNKQKQLWTHTAKKI